MLSITSGIQFGFYFSMFLGIWMPSLKISDGFGAFEKASAKNMTGTYH